jgi:hypothetical protein
VIAALAVHTGIAPSILWGEDPTDLATMLAVIEDQADQQRRAAR